jgi:prefoldin subunit 5
VINRDSIISESQNTIEAAESECQTGLCRLNTLGDREGSGNKLLIPDVASANTCPLMVKSPIVTVSLEQKPLKLPEP